MGKWAFNMFIAVFSNQQETVSLANILKTVIPIHMVKRGQNANEGAQGKTKNSSFLSNQYEQQRYCIQERKLSHKQRR